MAVETFMGVDGLWRLHTHSDPLGIGCSESLGLSNGGIIYPFVSADDCTAKLDALIKELES